MSDQALRIALVHPYAWPDVRRGGERYLDDLGWYLAAVGHDVDVITGTEGPSEVSTDGDITSRRRHHVVPGPLERRGVSPVDTFGVVALPLLLRRRYDVVHALTPTAAVAARLAGHRTLYTALGLPTPEQFGRRPLDRRLVAVGVRAATQVVALSAASAAHVEDMFGRRPSVLSPGVRTERFPRKQARRRGPARILFSADASDRRKGVDLALQAIVVLAERRPGTRLVLSGAGDHRWALEGLADAATHAQELTDVLGAGDPADIAARYRDATVTMMPAEDEAFGLAIVESLASGTPVVCSRDGGMTELVDDPAVGRTFPRRDVAALVSALEETIDLAGEVDTAVRCATHARRWDWQRAAGPAHEACYDALAARRRRTPI